MHHFSPYDMHQKNSSVDLDLIPEDDREAGGLPNKITVSKGTRIMLIRNINTPEGLVNGAMGYIEYIEKNDNNEIICIV